MIIVCELIPLLAALLYYKYAPKDPLKLTLVAWLTLAVLSFMPCSTTLSNVAIRRIHSILSTRSFSELFLNIFINNLFVLILCFIIGKAYLGYIIATTAFVARALAKGYPITVVFGAHTVLELYAYSISTSKNLKNLAKAFLYLIVAALIESWFIHKG